MRVLALVVSGELLPGSALAADRAGAKAPVRPRIVIAENTRATDKFLPRPDVVRAMVERGLQHLAGKRTTRDAWRSLVTTNDIVGLKVYSAPGVTSGTRPEVVAAVAATLIESGLPARNIVIWDRHMADLREAGFTALGERLGVRVEGAQDSGWDERVTYERALVGTPRFGDLEFGRKGDDVGRRSHVSKLLTRTLTRHVTISPLLNHNVMGVCGHLQSLALGSADNTLRFDAHVAHLFEAVPELFAMRELGDRAVLHVTDALLCQHEGEQRPLLHYSAALNQLWFSTDPVALDVLALEELQRQRKKAGFAQPKVSRELFHNAAQLELGVDDARRFRIEWVK
jgi:hypothetical protein